MNVKFNFVFTPEAESVAAAHEKRHPQPWADPWPDGLPVQGDLVSFGDEDSPMFEVASRLFIWHTHDELTVQLPLRLGLQSADPTARN